MNDPYVALAGLERGDWHQADRIQTAINEYRDEAASWDRAAVVAEAAAN